MQEYINNGTQLAWLIDRKQRQVFIYRPNCGVEELDNPKIENVVNIPLEEQKAGIVETAKSSNDYSNKKVKNELKEVEKQKRVSTRKKGVNLKSNI